MHVVKRRSPLESGSTESGLDTIAFKRQSSYFFDRAFPPNGKWMTTDLVSTDNFLRTTTKQPTNLLLTVVLLRAPITRLRASEVIRGSDENHFDSTELKETVGTEGDLNYESYLNIPADDQSTPSWEMTELCRQCVVTDRSLAFRTYCFSLSPLSPFSSRVTVPRLKLFCFTIAISGNLIVCLHLQLAS